MVVLMLDKAVGAFAPYLFEEKPLLRERYGATRLVEAQMRG